MDMPAPSRMYGRTLGRCSNTSSVSLQSEHTSNNGNSGTGNGNNLYRTVSDPVTANSSAFTRPYDETHISKPVTEAKTMLWEIREFEMIFTSEVERAMNFEIEFGRLGSMERHLPRRSRWKILFDVDPCGRIPALRVVQMSPENKTIFYKLEACIMEGAETVPERETEFKTLHTGYKEGTSDSTSEDNLIPFQSTDASFGGNEFLDKIQNHLRNGSLLVRVNMEILEDSSISSQ